ncbi:MAG: DEAD/DEAH box helicase family protein, partial [Candidatus Cloacimonetes bacterium]|nr:DEAD/DEAH box helicase family protein [Candidatus Cloacimonadota bacterium]MDY0230524.1 DEAD/DEAH box helicase family protein [Candidatus Cloacimonadaceae bacterium]
MNDFDQYTNDYISGVMSLRKPQRKALEILDDIFNYVHPTKNMNLDVALEEINKRYPICTDFERDFMSLAFVLATGVGKTRLMGTFITYLYTHYGVKNFFVVAPGKIVYDKLKQDLGDPSNPKYVFNGLGCFDNPPRIIADDDYRDKQIDMFDSDVKIYVFNIDKFNSENAKMRAINEYLGDSFFNQLAQLDDLVMIMDESHHYHADRGALSLNELNPILGLELTATPYYNQGSRQVPFKNAVYEYPLSASISDGYTRTPFAVTRQDVDFKSFGEDELDHTMLSDGLLCHETIKQELELYCLDNKEKIVKPFMMVVCKDTAHATKVFDYVTSTTFANGEYKDKTLLIHSNLPKAKKEGAVDLLQKVEEYGNPIEIVIHVDMLKEGWDVNNLYTIVPLRTATSKILREQMVGRGLRLPFGQRTGVKKVDSVMLTAHDKFEEILTEAQKGDSIFKAGNVIKVEELVRQKVKETE